MGVYEQGSESERWSARGLQPSAADAVAISADESDEWLVPETNSSSDVSIRRLGAHHERPSLPNGIAPATATLAERILLAEALEAERALELLPEPEHAAGPRPHAGARRRLPDQRPLPEPPKPRRNTPPLPMPAATRSSSPPLPPSAATGRHTPVGLQPPQPETRRSSNPPPPPVSHIHTTPHGILPGLGSEQAVEPRRSAPPPAPPSAATSRHTPAGLQPPQREAQRSSDSPPLPPTAATGRHAPLEPALAQLHPRPVLVTPPPLPAPEARPLSQTRRHSAAAPRPAAAQRSARAESPAAHRVDGRGQYSGARSEDPASPGLRETPSGEVLPPSPQQLQEQLRIALQRAQASEVRSVAAERRAAIAESAMRAAAAQQPGNLSEPNPHSSARTPSRASKALLWGAVCFSLGGYVALLVPIRERMQQQAETLRELGQRHTRALEAQRQVFQQQLEHPEQELEPK